MRQWGINTQTGFLTVDLKFFKRIEVKKTSKVGDILYISIFNNSFSILEKDWNEIIELIRDDKIEQLLKTNN